MAMVLSRPGQNLGTGDENTNFLKIMANEVLAVFRELNVMMPLHRTRTITSGKSAAFPVVGLAGAHWHTAGESVITDTDADSADYLNNIKSTEKEIFIDDPLVSPVLVTDIDTLKNHWDHRAEYVDALGRSLALEADVHIMSAVLAAARSAANISGDTPAGSSLNIVDDLTGPSLVAFAFAAAEQMDENRVPKDGRILLVRPSEYWTLVQETDFVNKDLTSGNGGLDSGVINRIAGLRIVATPNMPSTDLSAVTDSGAKNDPHGANGVGYNADWSNVGALAFHGSAVGTVKMMDLSMGSDYLLERLATLIVARYAMGHGVLRPECAVEMDITTIGG